MYDKRVPISFQFEQKPHILIVQASYYEDVAGFLAQGASDVLERAGVSFEVIDVPGALEIPVAIGYAVKAMAFDIEARRFDGYVALGCVLKGETYHDKVVGNESARGLMDIALRHTLAVGNGILTCDTLEQALKRAQPDGFDRGGAAAEACLRMIELKHLFGISSRRHWSGR